MSRRRVVADYPQEYLGIWQLACAGRLALEFPRRQTAMNQRQQLYAFRKQLSREMPPMAEPFFQADLRVVDTPSGKARLESYVPEWKLAVREALAATDGAMPLPQADKVVEALEQHLTGEAQSALEGKLEELGFKPE